MRGSGVVGLVLVLAACGDGSSAPPKQRHVVGGQLHGLWDGTRGAILRLQSDGIDSSLAVSSNGEFVFAEPVLSGEVYEVTVASNPRQHTCLVEAGGSGQIGDGEVAGVVISCRGPDAAIALSGSWGWRFDRSQDRQTFAGSLAVQDVALTVSGGDVITASIDGRDVALGEPTAPMALPLGSTTVEVALTARDGLSKTYELAFARGGALLDQLVYGKASNTDAWDSFGTALAMADDTLVVGAPAEASAATGVGGDQADNTAPGAGAVYVFVRRGATWTQQAYLKASNTQSRSQFGRAVALSGDTIAVGAFGENSKAFGIDGDQSDTSLMWAGAVYVFTRHGGDWIQEAYIKASNPDEDDEFGASVALSGDTLVVGAPGESSEATGVNGDQADNGYASAGAAYVFTRAGSTWSQQAYLKASNTGWDDHFGGTVAVSGDTLAVGAVNEDSAGTGINGYDGDWGWESGAVYVFARTGATWRQQAYVKASNTHAGDSFGAAIALAGDTLVVGAPNEESHATGVDGDQQDQSSGGAGAAYVFVRSGVAWSQQAYLKASNTEPGPGYTPFPAAGDAFGASVAVAGDTLAIGAPQERSHAIGIDGPQNNNDTLGAGAVYVFVRHSGTWAQHAYVKASVVGTGDGNGGNGDNFGSSVVMTTDALVVSASNECSRMTGVNPPGGQMDNSSRQAGAIYLFR